MGEERESDKVDFPSGVTEGDTGGREMAGPRQLTEKLGVDLFVDVRAVFGDEAYHQLVRELVRALMSGRETNDWTGVNQTVEAWARSVRLAQSPEFTRALDELSEQSDKTPPLPFDVVLERLRI